MIKTREELIYLLTQAAELEHLLVCQYLFTAFSIKRSEKENLTPRQMNAVDEWGQLLLLIARQEMEHLGLVNNILTSIGSMPHFERPNFPNTGNYYPFPLVLQRLDFETIQRYVCVEKPENVINPLCPEHLKGQTTNDVLSSVSYNSIAELYALLKEGFEKFPLPDEELFIGPPSAQVGGAELDLNFGRIGAEGGVYDVTLFPVYDRATALQAIKLITEQGEGTPHLSAEPSHYLRFLEIYKELKKMKEEDPNFDPSRNVVMNPKSYKHSNTLGGSLITDPRTNEVMAFFNSSYELMLMMLIRFYAHTNETPEEIKTLKFAAFFPFMTMIIRPLGEMLTRMPAFADQPDGPRAGAGFELSSVLAFLPHKQAAWILLSERMSTLTVEMNQAAKRKNAPEGLDYIAESMALINKQFSKNLLKK